MHLSLCKTEVLDHHPVEKSFSCSNPSTLITSPSKRNFLYDPQQIQLKKYED